MPLATPAHSAARRTAFLLSCLITALLAGGLSAPSATAAAVPTTRDYGPSIDHYSRYQAETSCSATEKPGPQQVRDLLRRTYGSSVASNIVRPCSAAGSGHEEGRSIDWMTNVRNAQQRDMAETFVGWLLASDKHGNAHAMARRMGIMYIIWDNKMWRAYDTKKADPYGNFTGGWTTYTTTVTVDGKRVKTPCTAPEASSKTYDNLCHRNHVHISFGWDGALAKTSYYAPPGPASCATSPSLGRLPDVSLDGLGYVPVEPTRLLDTRVGNGSPGACRVGAGDRLDLQVTGRGPIPSSGVAAVALNITATDALGNTWVSAYPAGGSFSGTSSINARLDQTRAALVVVPVGAAGRVSLLSGYGATHLVADVVGYYPTAAGAGQSYVDAPPRRIFDTRGDTAMVKGTSRQVQVRGRAGVPADATAVVMNVTVTSPATSGYVSVTPTAPSGRAATSTVNFRPGQTVANRAFVPIGPDGTVSLYSLGDTHVVLDVVGWFAPASKNGTRYVPLTPNRVLDTRSSASALQTFSGTGDAQPFRIVGKGGVPEGATSVVVTLTGTKATHPTHVTASAGGAPTPKTSDLNLMPGEDAANLAVVPVGPDGTIVLRNNAGTADTVIDVLGYYRP